MNLFRFVKYLPRVFIKKGLPLNLIYFVTAKCNARCRHCFYWKELNTPKDELDLAQIEKVAKSVPSLMSLSLTGGEPFLRNDLAQIALLFSRFTKVAHIQLPTNGLLTEKIFETTLQILKKLRQDTRLVVAVSVDDLGSRHDAVRQVEGCFEKAKETIKRLKPLEAKFPNFQLSCCITINKDNQQRINNLVDYLKDELGVEFIGVNLIRSEVKDMSLKKVDVRYYDDVVERNRQDFLKKFSQQKKPDRLERILSARLYCGARLLSKIYSQQKFITPCYAGSLLAIMYENGDIYPCEMLNFKMGSLKDFDFNFKKLWLSKQAQKVRRTIKKSKCFCTYECAMTLNTFFNLRHLLTILRDSLRKK